MQPHIVRSVPYRPYYYRPGFNLSLNFGYPTYQAYRSYPTYQPYQSYPTYPTYPTYPSYPSHPTYPSYPSYGYVEGQAFGGVRIDLPQREAQVFVDGYYTGSVNDFDGVLQHLDLTPGPHHIEVRADGYEPIAFDVNVQPGRTITYSADMLRARP